MKIRRIKKEQFNVGKRLRFLVKLSDFQTHCRFECDTDLDPLT